MNFQSFVVLLRKKIFVACSATRITGNTLRLEEETQGEWI